MTPKDFDIEKKIEILNNALDERYKSIHTIRERIQNICLWLLGLFTTIAGWIVASSKIYSEVKTLAMVVCITVIFVAIRVYLKDLNKGFNAQRIVAGDIENSLGLFDKDFIQVNGNTVYPDKWRKSGHEGCEGKFFHNNLVLLWTGYLLLLMAIIFKSTLIQSTCLMVLSQLYL